MRPRAKLLSFCRAHYLSKVSVPTGLNWYLYDSVGERFKHFTRVLLNWISYITGGYRTLAQRAGRVV